MTSPRNDLSSATSFGRGAFNTASTFAPELEVGSYRIDYEVAARGATEADFDASDNANGDPFISSDSLFAKDNGLGIGGLRPGGGGDWEFGNYYLISPLASGFVATNVTFGGARNSADGPMAGAEASVFPHACFERLFDFPHNCLPALR